MRLSNKKINYYFSYRYRDRNCINVFFSLSNVRHGDCVAALLPPVKQPAIVQLYFVFDS